MQVNRPRYITLDEAIAAEVRAEFARQSGAKTVTELAEKLDLRRATLSARINGHQPFTAGLLKEVARYLGTTLEDLSAEAERQLDKEQVPV